MVRNWGARRSLIFVGCSNSFESTPHAARQKNRFGEIRVPRFRYPLHRPRTDDLHLTVETFALYVVELHSSGVASRR